MASKIETLIGITVKEEVSASMAKVKKSMQDLEGTSKRTTGFVKDLFRELAGPAAGVGVAAGLGMVIKSSIESATALEGLNRRAKSLYGESFPQIQASLQTFSDQVGRSDNDLLEFASRFTAIERGAGLSKEQADDFSVSLSKLTVDFASFYDIADEDAFGLIQDGLVGAGKQLKRYGIDVDDTNVQQFAFSKGIRDNVSDMSDAQKTFLKSQLLLKELSDVEGDAAGNADTLSNQTKRMKGEWQDFEEQLGASLIPWISGAIHGMSEALDAVQTSVANVKRALAIEGSGGRYDTVKGADGNDYVVDVSALDGISEERKAQYAKLTAQNKERAEGERMVAEQKKKYEEEQNFWKNYYATGPKGLGDDKAGEKEKERLKQVKEALKDLEDEYDDARRDIGGKLSDLEQDHKDSMEQIQESIDDTLESLDDLKTGYDKTLADLSASFKRTQEDFNSGNINSAADQIQKVADLEQKLKDIQVKRDQEGYNGGGISFQTNEEFLRTQKELDKERAALEAYLRSNPGLESQARTQSGLTDFEQSINRDAQGFARDQEDYEKRLANEQAEYDQRKQHLEQDLADLETKKRVEQEAYQITRQELTNTLASLSLFHDDWSVKMKDIAKVTKEQVDAIAAEIARMKTLMGSSQISARADYNVANDVDTRRTDRTSNVTVTIGSISGAGQDPLTFGQTVGAQIARSIQLQQLGAN